MYTRMVTRRFYAVLSMTAVTLFSAVASGFAVFYFLLYALLGALLGSFVWSYVNIIGVRVTAERRWDQAKVGGFIETNLDIANNSLFPKVLLEIQDMEDLPGQAAGVVMNLLPFQRANWTGLAPLRKRGVFPLGPVRVYGSDLFGLFRLRKSFAGVDEVTVYPATIDLPLLQLAATEGFHQQGVMHQRTHDVTPSVSTVREYAYGDSLRRIHWPATTRASKLMVKEFDADLRNQIWIVLDLDQSVQAGEEIENTEEYGVTLAASIALKFVGMDWPVGFIAYGDQRYFLGPQRSTAAHERLLGMLAVVRAQGSESLAQVLRRERAQFTSASTVIVITPSQDPGWIQGLQSVLGGRSHLAAVLIDATSFLSRLPRNGYDQDQVYSQVSSTGVLTYTVRKGEQLGSALDYRAAIPEQTILSTL